MPITRPTFAASIAENGIEDGSSQHATLGLGQVECTRKLKCSWAESGKAAQHFLGYSRLTTAGVLERLLPMSHPDDPALVATRLTIASNHRFVGSRGANPALPGSRTNTATDGTIQAKYDAVFVEVFYERPLYDLKEDADIVGEGGTPQEFLRYVDWGVPEPEPTLITMPGHALKLVVAPGQPNPFPSPNTSQAISYNVPRQFTQSRLKVTWKRLPADFIRWFNPGPWLKRVNGNPWGSPPTDPYLYTVNKTDFGPYPAGTLRLDQVQIERRPAPFVLYTPPSGGETVATWISPAVEYDAIMTLIHNPAGHLYLWHNHITPPGVTNKSGFFYASRTSTYHAPGSVPKGDSLFNEAEFRDLFVPGELPVSP